MSSACDFAIIGSGRDAGDIPFMQTEKWATLIRQSIYVSAEHPT
jgi:hypothetical protein